jgi:3'-phosphoadenosine 5'-phosphosulfate sulfotransferase (PAPS reductase)/FAD synthetase
MKVKKHIVTISGGLTSAFVANMVIQNEKPELVFTDTGWEDADLFRFLKDLEQLFKRKITRLNHPKYKNPEELFFKTGMLGSNRVPNCSRFLKVEVLQKYLKEKYNNQCIVYFGIDYSEKHRADRIKFQYDKLGIETRFPLVESKDFFIKDKIIEWLKENNIEIPRLYKDGYLHNNCSGGCVRAGKKSWLHLLKTNPEVYRERERVESSFKEGKYTFIKGISLKKLRETSTQDPPLFEEDMPCVCFEV